MKILVVSATEKEIFSAQKVLKPENKRTRTDFLVSGIGCTFTTYMLSRELHKNNYDFVIDAGIAGSFNPSLKIGEVVNVYSDQFADLGIEDKNNYYTIFEKDFIDKNQFPFSDSKLINPNNIDLDIKKVSGITVNTTHGNKTSIQLFKEKFNADIETMEGAAIFYVCLLENIPFLQIRAISNYVEERNTANWNIPLAIKNLNNKLIEIIEKI